MATIEHQLLIQAPCEKVWKISRDYDIRNSWDSFSHRTELEHPNLPIVIGSRVLVHAKNGLRMTVEYVQYQAPYIAAIDMLNGPRFLSRFAGSWRFRELPGEATLAIFRYYIKAKFWALPVVSEKLATLYFGHIVKQRLAGLKRYCEAME